jgi:hypothetical protein
MHRFLWQDTSSLFWNPSKIWKFISFFICFPFGAFDFFSDDSSLYTDELSYLKSVNELELTVKRNLTKEERSIRKEIKGTKRETNKERDEFPYFRWIPK